MNVACQNKCGLIFQDMKPPPNIKMISCHFHPPQKINIKCPKCGYINQFKASATDKKGNWIIDNVPSISIGIPKKKGKRSKQNTRKKKLRSKQLKPDIDYKEIEKLLESAIEKINTDKKKAATEIFQEILKIDPNNNVAKAYIEYLNSN